LSLVLIQYTYLEQRAGSLCKQQEQRSLCKQQEQRSLCKQQEHDKKDGCTYMFALFLGGLGAVGATAILALLPLKLGRMRLRMPLLLLIAPPWR